MLIKVSELREREVINVCDGKRLGNVCDILVDVDCGQICAIFVSDHFFTFGGKDSIKIEWKQIVCFGEDTILVDIGKTFGDQ